ncbi:MAG TPA: hypothetical protein VIO64_17295 [Pseudobacteroides sp.]|uniref:hypothetical protein n=1 Tax=Pseudobacteroides sp. TaxID=1968840 RepID=UPI002F927677
MKTNHIDAEKKSPLSIIACVIGKHRTSKANTEKLVEDTKENIKDDIKDYFTDYFNCKAAPDNSIEVPLKADTIVSNNSHEISSETDSIEEYSSEMHHAKETSEINQNKSKKTFKPDVEPSKGIKKQNDEIKSPYLEVVLISTDEHGGLSMNDSDKTLNNNQNYPDTSLKEVEGIPTHSEIEPKVIEIPPEMLTNFLSIFNQTNGSIPLDSLIKITKAPSEPLN